MEENINKQPLLSSYGEVDRLTPSISNSSTHGSDDIHSINGVKDFFREFNTEFKKLWYLAAPSIFTTICQYSLGAITQVFAGHVSTLALAAISIENSVIAGFSFGMMVGIIQLVKLF